MSWGGNGGALLAGMLLAARLAAAPPPTRAEAEATWRSAVAAEQAALRAVEAAEAQARAASLALARVGAGRDTFARSQEAVAAARSEIVALLAERARVDVLPAGASARRRELRRQWDLLAPVRDHLPAGAWHALDRELRASKAALAAAQKARETRKQGVDERLRGARDRLASARRALLAASRVELPEAEWRAWWEAAAGVTRARAALGESQEKVLAAHATRLEAAAHGAPVHLAAVEVQAGGRLRYQARWEGRDVDPGEHARLRDVRRDLAEIRRDRGAGAAQRLALAQAARPDVVAIQGAAADYGSALMSKEVGVLLTEIGVTAAELALTGGGATLARKAAEATEKAAALAARSARSATREAAGQLESKALGDAIHKAADGAGALGMDEAVKARKLWRKQYLDEVAARARAQTTGSPEARRKAAEAARRQGEKALAALDKKARRMAWSEETGRKLTARTRELGDRVAEELATTKADFRRGAVSASLAKATAGIGNRFAPAAEGQPSEAARRVLVSDLLERGLAVGLEAGAKGAKEALGELGTDASRWRRLGKGAVGFGKGLKLQHLRKVGANPANLLGLVGTMAKAGVAGYYQGEANEAQARFWQAFAALRAVEDVIARGVEADRELAGMEAEHLRALAAAEAAYTLGVRPRRRILTVNEALPGGAPGKLQLTFSGPISQAPEVMAGAGRAALERAGASWSGSLPLPEAGGTVPLQVTLPRGAHPLGPLDGDPSTPAYRNPRGFAWRGWERTPDAGHILRVSAAARRPETAPADPRIPHEGNYLASFAGLPGFEGPLEVVLSRGGGYKVPDGGGRYRFVRDPDATWSFLAHRPSNKGGERVATIYEGAHAGSLRVAAGAVTFRLAATPPGSHARSVEVRLAGPGDGDLRGSWKGDTASGPVQWTRVRGKIREVRAKILAHPKFSFRVARLPAWQGIDRFHDAPVVARAGPGASLGIDLGRWYQPGDVEFFFTPESYAKARGNRPRLRLEVYGEGLWGRHYVSVAAGSGLECAGSSPIHDAGGVARGRRVDLTMWQGLRPGAHALWLDGEKISFRLAMPGR